jgi:hypothetical protein
MYSVSIPTTVTPTQEASLPPLITLSYNFSSEWTALQMLLGERAIQYCALQDMLCVARKAAFHH